MIRTLISSSGIYLGSGVLSKSLPLLLLPILTHYLSPQEYGLVALFQVLTAFALAVVGMNLNLNISRDFAAQSQSEMAVTMGTLTGVLGASAIVFALCLETALAAGWLAWLNIPALWLHFLPAIGFMVMAYLFYMTLLRVRGRPWTYFRLECANALCGFMLTLLFVAVLAWQWEGRILAMILPQLGFGIVALALLYRSGYLHWSFNFDKARRILALCVPLIPHTVATTVIVMADRYFLELMIGTEAVGVYTVAYLFGMTLMLFSDAFIKAWSPWFYKVIALHSAAVDRQIVAYSYLYMLALLALGVALSLLLSWLLPWLVSPQYQEAAPLIFWIALGHVIFGYYQLFFPYLVQGNCTGFVAISSSLAAVCNCALNYLLIPHYGMLGAALATIAAYAVSLLLVFGKALQIRPMPWIAATSRR